MIPPPFEYERASDIAHAIKLLAAAKGEAKILAGGQSLIPLMRFRLAEPSLLIDIGGLRDLAYIRKNGALTKRAEVMVKHLKKALEYFQKTGRRVRLH